MRSYIPIIVSASDMNNTKLSMPKMIFGYNSKFTFRTSFINHFNDIFEILKYRHNQREQGSCSYAN